MRPMFTPVGPGGRREGRRVRQRRAALAATALIVLVVLLSGARAGAEPPVASFTVSPSQPLSGETTVFASAATGTLASQSWDLDGDGRCNDAAGPRAERSFAVAGTYPVRLCVDGPEGEASQVRRVTVLNRPPMPSFTSLPDAPVAGEPITFMSTSSDPDGLIAAVDWDLDGDGVHAEAAGTTAPWSYGRAGTYAVGVRVRDNLGAEAIATRTLTVAPAPLRPMVPIPLVRLSGRIIGPGMVVTALTVKAPRRARVVVLCKGGRRRGCRFRRISSSSRRALAWKVGRARGVLRAGAVLEVYVRRRGALGKFTRVAIRAGHPPRRTDACLPPAPARPGPCRSRVRR